MTDSLAKQFLTTKPGDVGIIGDPVDHSLSPVMQNAAFQTWWGAFRDRDEKTPEYHKFHVKIDQLEDAVELAKKHQLRGLNVTVPHKETICEFVDEFDPFAKKIGAVNTLSFMEKRVRGFNTDGDGFRRALERDVDYDMEGKIALVLGAGGTGIVLIEKLIEMNAAKILVWNRTPERLSQYMKRTSAHEKQIETFSAIPDVKRACHVADLLVNATSVGLRDGDPMPVAELPFRSDQIVFDVIYHRDTEFLRQARHAGAKAVSGLGMFLYQGAQAFQIWTGAPAPHDIMRTTLNRVLGGK